MEGNKAILRLHATGQVRRHRALVPPTESTSCSRGQSDKRPCGTAEDRATRGDVSRGQSDKRPCGTAGDRATRGHVEQQGTGRQEAMWNSRGQSDKRPCITARDRATRGHVEQQQRCPSTKRIHPPKVAMSTS